MSDYPIKLVRDGYLGRDVGGLTFRPVDRPEHVARLRQKLVEEAGEYVAAPSLDELADVVEVALTLAVLAHGATADDLAEARGRKNKRGGFALGVVMFGPPIPGEVVS